jgi:hypothetical protein
MRNFITNIVAGMVAMATVTLSVPSHAEAQMTKDRLVGAWHLVAFKATTGDQTSRPLGEHPGGYIGFSPNRFWVMLVDTDRKAPASATLTDPEAVSLMKTGVAYTGKYAADPAETPDGIKVTVHVDAAVNQAISGTDRVFFMRVDDNRLTLKSPAVVIPMTGATSVVQLDFVKAD